MSIAKTLKTVKIKTCRHSSMEYFYATNKSVFDGWLKLVAEKLIHGLYQGGPAFLCDESHCSFFTQGGEKRKCIL